MNWTMLPAMAPQEGQSPGYPIMMMVLMIAIMYFLMIRPTQRREKERRAMLGKLSKGDRVLFGGGLIGVIASMKDKSLTVKCGETKLEVSRSAVSAVLGKDDDVEKVAEQASR